MPADEELEEEFSSFNRLESGVRDMCTERSNKIRSDDQREPRGSRGKRDQVFAVSAMVASGENRMDGPGRELMCGPALRDDR